MKTKYIYIASAAVLILGVGLMLMAKNNSNKVSDNYKDISGEVQEQAIPNSNNNSNTESINNNSNTNSNPPMTEQSEFKNKFVTLSVEGFGDIKIDLYDEDAPKTVENFLRLTSKKYYDGITFHRIAKGFVVQGGDPTGTGSGGESAFGGQFEDELNPNTASYKAGYQKGVVAMANRGPNTNTSQFFIMLGDNQLPNNYTIFGKVVAGLDVVDKIGAVPITPQMGPTDGTPQQKITITKATISDK